MGSVAWTRPPVSRCMSQVSMVPNAISPASARARSAGSLLEQPGDLAAGEVRVEDEARSRSWKSGSWPAALSRAQISAVCRLCQTIARWTGWPVRRSHRTVVSRWFVMPIARTPRPADARAPASASRSTRAARLPDLLGVVLDPARRGVVLRDLGVGAAEHLALGAEDDRGGAGGALVERDDGGVGSGGSWARIVGPCAGPALGPQRERRRRARSRSSSSWLHDVLGEAEVEPRAPRRGRSRPVTFSIQWVPG